MSQDEITVMDGSKCIFQLRGVRPFLSEKFDITKHKNYKLLEDFDKKNAFDIEDYISRKGKAKLNKNSMITRLWYLSNYFMIVVMFVIISYRKYNRFTSQNFKMIFYPCYVNAI